MKRKHYNKTTSRIICIAFTLVLISTFLLCTRSEASVESPALDENVRVEAIKEESMALSYYLSFEDALQSSSLIVEARFIQEHKYKSYSELEFEIISILRGAVDETRIFIYQEKVNVSFVDAEFDYVSGTTSFIPEDVYILVLERHSLVYYEHDRYLLIGELYLPSKDLSDSSMYGQPLIYHSESPDSKHDLRNRIEVIVKNAPVENNFFGNRFTKSCAVVDAVNFADLVLVVKPVEVLLENEIDQTVVCRCTVLDIQVGKLELDEILVVFFADSVQVGTDYIINAVRVEPNSLIFTLASKDNSVAILGSKLASEITLQASRRSDMIIEKGD